MPMEFINTNPNPKTSGHPEWLEDLKKILVELEPGTWEKVQDQNAIEAVAYLDRHKAYTEASMDQFVGIMNSKYWAGFLAGAAFGQKSMSTNHNQSEI